MPNVDDVFGGDTLKAIDLQGRDVTLTIKHVEVVKYDAGAKLKIGFERTAKCLIANKTNSTRIKSMYGPHTEQWPGRKITLYPEMVPFQGKEDWAIRVRLKPQDQSAPAPQPKLQPHDPGDGFENPPF